MYVSQQGETIEALHARSRAFASVFVDFIDRVHPEWETVLLVSHAGTAITLGRAFVGKPQANIRAYVASLSCYERESAGDGVWQCTLNGSCAHLKDGELVCILFPSASSAEHCRSGTSAWKKMK